MKVRIMVLNTQIHGVPQWEGIENILNRIGASNIMHITSIDKQLIVIYKEEQ